MSPFTEPVVDQAALAWRESLGWCVRHGLDIAPGEAGAERSDYAAQVVLEARLRNALIRLNPALPLAALERLINGALRREHAAVAGTVQTRAIHSRRNEDVGCRPYTCAAAGWGKKFWDPLTQIQ